MTKEEYIKWWRKNNPEKVKAQKQRYEAKRRQENPKLCANCGKVLINRRKKRCDECYSLEVSERYADWAKRNAEHDKKRKAEWYQKNKKRIARQQKRYRDSLK